MPLGWKDVYYEGYLPELTVYRLLESESPVEDIEVAPALETTTLACYCMAETLLKGLLLLDCDEEFWPLAR